MPFLNSIRKQAHFLILMLVLILALACSQSPQSVKPLPTIPQAFSDSGDTPLEEKWWMAFNDAGLNAIMEQALAENFSLRAAWDRLEQARQTAIKAGAALLPSLDGTGSAGRSRTVTDPDHNPSPSKNPRVDYSNHFSLGLAASYEVDLWGRLRAAQSAAGLDVQATREDLDAAAISLTARIAETWFLLIEKKVELAILDEQYKTNKKQLNLIDLKFRRGKADASDVLQQEQVTEGVRGDRILVMSTIEVLENTLAILAGVAPGELEYTVPEKLPDPPAMPDTGIPAEWLRHRPDLRAAELRVLAADHRVHEAFANRFPRISLTASASTSSDRYQDLFDNWVASIAANLVAPLFDAGLRKAEVARTRAVVSQHLNEYSQASLEAIKEVEDALTQERRQAEYLESLGRQLQFSKDASDRILDNYIGGSADFNRYLTALLAWQRLQVNYLRGRNTLITYRIDLYRALAGSWPMQEPVAQEISE
ncbi:MAG: efflux transporter outer membrane subunit [Candidatus Sumerlaeota bacterium]